jgi:hypothetical protein
MIAVKSRILHFLAGLACLCVFANAGVLRADVKIDFQCAVDFKSVISETEETLALSGVAVATLANGKTYLLSLGTTANQSKQNPSTKARLDTRKVAEAKARKAAAEFLNVEVSTENRLSELKKTEATISNGGVKNQVTKLTKVREEIITQKSQVAFAGSKTVATWLSDDGETFNAVIASEITNTKSK